MQFLHKRALLLLRISLGVTFAWIGVLKLFNSSPVQDVINNSIPYGMGESQLFIFLLAIVEIALGVSFLANRFVKTAATIMIISVSIISILVFVTAGFDPRFPVLSLVGESVLKNLIIISAGLILLSENTANIEKRAEPQKITHKAS